MSSEIRNEIICDSNIDIMNYLVLKLESRQKNLSKYANIFNTIDSYESFYQRRKDIFLLFKNLEEELHQAALAIKALVVQNKSLSHENPDIKSIQKNYNKLLQENNYLLIENNNYAKKLKEIKNNNRYKSPKRTRSPSFKSASKKKTNQNYFNNNNNNQIKPMKRISSDRKIKKFNSNYNQNKPMKRISSDRKIKRFNNKININNNRNKNNIKSKDKIDNEDIYNCDLDLNDVRQLKNVKNIMKDMKNNKNKLRAMIEEHFGNNRAQGNDNNTYYTNI